jgi:hypothetical protein
MKTQIVLGSYNITSFPVPPARANKSGRVNGGSPIFPGVSSGQVAAGGISSRRPVPHDNSSLPASLDDWLVCKGAVEICRKSSDETENGSRAWAMAATPVTRGKNLSAAIARP